MAGRTVALLVAWLTWSLLASFGGSPEPARPGVQAGPFSHVTHVPRVWFGGTVPEVFRDCRGCHRFDANQTVSAPQAVCDSCHTGAGKLRVTASKGFAKDLAGYQTRTREAFRHHTHGALECRECHLSPRFYGEAQSHIEINTGPGQCQRCHEAGTVTAEVVGRFRWWQRPETLDPVAYAKDLVDVFGGPRGQLNVKFPLPTGGQFDHGDHGEIGCEQCHVDTRAAAAQSVGQVQVPADGCKKCHITDQNNTPAVPAAAPKLLERPLWSLGAFAHADHFAKGAAGRTDAAAIATPAAFELIAKQNCAACHSSPTSQVGLRDRDFPFDAVHSKHTYLQCTGCHASAAWSTGESKQKPLHASSIAVDPTVGKGNWDGCKRCHVLGGDDMKRERVQETVRRRGQSTFVFPANTHPDITTRGVAQQGRPALQDCAKCHRAQVPELSSRLQTKAFRHATHLPEDAAAAEAACRQCHPAAQSSKDSATLGDAAFRVYSLDSCTTCHWGGPVTESASQVEPAPAAVVSFPHQPHVVTGKLACSSCHEPAADGGDIRTKPKANDCSQCHDHSLATEGPRTEAIFDENAASCVKCHHRDLPGGTAAAQVCAVPPPRPEVLADPRYRTTQPGFGGFTASQFHPTDRRCGECHLAGLDANRVLAVRAVLTGADHIQVKEAPGVHQNGYSPAECLRCHWKPLPQLKAGVGGTAEQIQWRGEPQSPATRQRFGNLSRGYPGGADADG
jgi:hypothetical protein